MEIIVDVAFAIIPSILGLGAAGLLGHGIINTTREIRNSISLLKTVGPGLLYGTAMAGKGLNIGRKWAAERLKQSDSGFWRGVGNVLTPYQWAKSKWKKKNQDTQGKQEGQGGGGSDKTDGQGKIIPFEEFTKKRQQQDGGGDDKSPPVPPTA